MASGIILPEHRGVDPRLLTLASIFKPRLVINLGDFAGQRTVKNQLGVEVTGYLQGTARISKEGLHVDGSTNCNLVFPHTFGVSNTSNSALLVGATFPSGNQSGALIKVGEAGGIAIGIGNSTMDSDGAYATGLLENVAWVSSTTPCNDGYHTLIYQHYNSTGDRAAISVDGTTAVGGSGAGSMGTVDGNTYIGGYSTRTFNGIIHWVMILEHQAGEPQLFAAAQALLPKVYPPHGYVWKQRDPDESVSFFNLASGGNLTLSGTNTDLSLTGQTATANLSFLGTEASATLTGQTATTNLSLVGTNATATLTGQDGTFSLTGALTLAGENTDLSLTGQTATANVTLVGTDGALTLAGQTSTANISLVGTVGDLTLTGQDGTFTVGGPLTLTGTSADLSLIGYDGEFVLTVQTRGGRGKAKIKKRRRLVTADDTSDLLEVIQDLEEEKLALQKVQEKQKKVLTKKEPLQQVLNEVVESLKAEESAEVAELKAITVLVSHVEVMAQTINKLEHEIEELEKKIEENHGKMVKKVQQLEDLVIILNNA